MAHTVYLRARVAPLECDISCTFSPYKLQERNRNAHVQNVTWTSAVTSQVAAGRAGARSIRRWELSVMDRHLPSEGDDPGFSYHGIQDDDQLGSTRDVRIPMDVDGVALDVPVDSTARQQSQQSTETWTGSDGDSAALQRRSSCRQLVSATEGDGASQLLHKAPSRRPLADDPPSFGGAGGLLYRELIAGD